MNNIAVAKETIDITAARSYCIGENTVVLPPLDYDYAKVYSPEDGEYLLKENLSEYSGGKMCGISVTAEDSFQAAKRFNNPFVMNFANAHIAGGGFMLGANAQEEALCRCSTLYASISSISASEMYKFNNSHISSVESDYMILSPNVCVFRSEKYELLAEPFMAAVITVPAPNKRGAALFTSEKKIAETMIRRIRILLRIAVKEGYRDLILGAWGCGAFGNDPYSVAGYFRDVLINEEYGKFFDNVCFAVYGSEDGKNITAFRSCFD